MPFDTVERANEPLPKSPARPRRSLLLLRAHDLDNIARHYNYSEPDAAEFWRTWAFNKANALRLLAAAPSDDRERRIEVDAATVLRLEHGPRKRIWPPGSRRDDWIAAGREPPPVINDLGFPEIEAAIMAGIHAADRAGAKLTRGQTVARQFGITPELKDALQLLSIPFVGDTETDRNARKRQREANRRWANGATPRGSQPTEAEKARAEGIHRSTRFRRRKRARQQAIARCADAGE